MCGVEGRHPYTYVVVMTCLHKHTHLYEWMCVHIHICVYMFFYTCVVLRVDNHLHIYGVMTCIHKHTHLYEWMCVHIHIRVSMFQYTCGVEGRHPRTYIVVMCIMHWKISSLLQGSFAKETLHICVSCIYCSDGTHAQIHLFI